VRESIHLVAREDSVMMVDYPHNSGRNQKSDGMGRDNLLITCL
jgi:hypothetical protein